MIRPLSSGSSARLSCRFAAVTTSDDGLFEKRGGSAREVFVDNRLVGGKK